MKQVDTFSEVAHVSGTENSTPEAFTHEELAEIGQVYRDNYAALVYKAKTFNVSDPESTAQTAFEKALKNWDKYEDRGYTRSAWLHKILTNTALTELRRNRTIDEEPSSDLYLFEDNPDLRASAQFDNVENNDQLARVKEILADKPEHWYQIIELLTLGYTNIDISRMLNINTHTVQSSLFRVRKLFREDADAFDALGIQQSMS